MGGLDTSRSLFCHGAKLLSYPSQDRNRIADASNLLFQSFCINSLSQPELSGLKYDPFGEKRFQRKPT